MHKLRAPRQIVFNSLKTRMSSFNIPMASYRGMTG
jgi:hypothetical protein